MEEMEPENPWKNKSRIKIVATCDAVSCFHTFLFLYMVAFTGIAYSTLYMFSYYFKSDRDIVKDALKEIVTSHLPFLIFLWTGNLLFFTWQIAVAVVLYTSVNLEAMDTDPYVAIQKCNCWLRTSRAILAIVVIKLLCIPALVWLKLSYEYDIVLGIVELVFRCFGACFVRSFIQDLQT